MKPRSTGFPHDPAMPLPQQEPRTVITSGWQRPTGEQSLGTARVDVPSRIAGGDGIRVELENRGYVVSMDIAELTIAEDADPSQMWLPVWSDGQPAAEVRRAPVSAIPIDAPADGLFYGRKDHAWADMSTLPVGWDSITGKPPMFPPDLHTHPINEVENLQYELDLRPTDAPPDGTQYARQDGAWTAVDSTVVWGEITGIPDLVEEAPSDGEQYVRQNGAWAEVVIPASGIPEAPNDGKQYARKSLAWAEVAIPPGGSTIEVGDAPPTGKPDKTLWWESDTGGLFLLYNDGNTSQWVQVNGSRDSYATIRLNPQVITADATVPTGYNGMTAGPITIASGVTVSVASGSVWTVV